MVLYVPYRTQAWEEPKSSRRLGGVLLSYGIGPPPILISPGFVFMISYLLIERCLSLPESNRAFF